MKIRSDYRVDDVDGLYLICISAQQSEPVFSFSLCERENYVMRHERYTKTVQYYDLN